jgi:hypothetical protein
MKTKSCHKENIHIFVLILKSIEVGIISRERGT